MVSPPSTGENAEQRDKIAAAAVRIEKQSAAMKTRELDFLRRRENFEQEVKELKQVLAVSTWRGHVERDQMKAVAAERELKLRFAGQNREVEFESEVSKLKEELETESYGKFEERTLRSANLTSHLIEL